jgi:hypothetical protein
MALRTGRARATATYAYGELQLIGLPACVIPRLGRDAPDDVPVTPRGLAVLWPIADDLSNIEITATLEISEETVKTYVPRVLPYWTYTIGALLVAYAYRNGMVAPCRSPCSASRHPRLQAARGASSWWPPASGRSAQRSRQDEVFPGRLPWSLWQCDSRG